MDYLAIPLWAIWLSIFSLNLFGIYLCLNHLNPLEPKTRDLLPPVTILKPIKGADPRLQENLESFFNLDYPTYELLISVADQNDPAVPIIRALLEKYANQNVRLYIGERILGVNPKVNNLAQSYSEAQFDWIWISDSNVKIWPDELLQMMSQVDENTGVLTCLVAGRDATSIGAHLEAVYLNTFYAKWMMLAAYFKKPCVVGKAMLFKKSMAQRFGGIQVLSRYLAEDFMAGEATRKLGLSVLIGRRPVHQVLGGNYSLKDFWNRHIRWGRIRKSQSPSAFFTEILTQCIPCAFVLYWASSGSRTWMGLHFLIWFLGDVIVYTKMNGLTFPLLPILGWLTRELLAFPMWFHTTLGNTVLWRGKNLRLLEGGLLETEHTPS